MGNLNPEKLIVLITAFFISCSASKKMTSPKNSSSLPQEEYFDKQGHRGCRGLMPENTIPAMITALNHGVTTLEMDVVITKDRQVVVSHDPWFDHNITTKPDGSYINLKDEKKYNIYQMTYDEVKNYDVGMKPHPRFPQQQKLKVIKPLLSNLIDSVENYMRTSKRPHPFYNIETKCLPLTDNKFHPDPPAFVDLLMAVVNDKGISDKVIIQSFDFRTLQYLHRQYPSIKTAMLIEDYDKRSFDDQLKSLGFTPTIYSPHYSLVNNELIKKCHEKNIKVIPWTVNDKEAIERLKSMGLDGLITDYPNLF